MKKINSIGYGHIILALAAVFLLAAPILCSLLFTISNIHLFKTIAYISLGVGTFIVLFLAVLLAVEFHQDKVINRNYAEIKKTKVLIGNGIYECQSCGYRVVKKTDNECTACGIKFNEESML